MQRTITALLLVCLLVTGVRAECRATLVPGIENPEDIIEACSNATSFGGNPCFLTKTSTWFFRWSDGLETNWNVSVSGERLWSQTSCCSLGTARDCFPIFHPPRFEEGQVTQDIQFATVVFTESFCPVCANKKVFQRCNFDLLKTRRHPYSCTTIGEGGGCSTDIDFGDNFEPVDPIPTCPPGSPILIDIQGNGFALTDAANGVSFDLRPNGNAERIAWTGANSDDAFLVLDRNGNGLGDDGTELFGNYTPQLTTTHPHGFLALAEFDQPLNGGNLDDAIDAGDAVFASLKLWRDVNHNGVSEPAELFTLPATGASKFDLDFKEKKRRDEHRNWFRYRAKVYDSRGADLGRWAWDVFFVNP